MTGSVAQTQCSGLATLPSSPGRGASSPTAHLGLDTTLAGKPSLIPEAQLSSGTASELRSHGLPPLPQQIHITLYLLIFSYSPNRPYARWGQELSSHCFLFASLFRSCCLPMCPACNWCSTNVCRISGLTAGLLTHSWLLHLPQENGNTSEAAHLLSAPEPSGSWSHGNFLPPRGAEKVQH